jgi:hypothetical protein
MPRNGSGTFSLATGNPVVSGTVIDADWANDTLADIGNEITNSLSRTGAGGMLSAFRLADGTVTAPGLAFTNETNTGIYRSGSGEMWLAVGGVAVAQVTANGLLLPSGRRISLPAPVSGGDATNKTYVDTQVAPAVEFSTYYLGSKTSDPTLNNQGGALVEGAMYWNSTLDQLRVYNGTNWIPSPTISSLVGQTFSGTGAQIAFTLANPTGNAINLEVFISGVRQVPTTNYTVSGTTLTFTVAPPSGTDNIFVRYAQLGTITDGAGSIVYTPAGTGAVATTVQSKLRESVSVLDFGADPTGVADSTVAIQAANTAAVSLGKALYFPGGNYLCQSITLSAKGAFAFGDATLVQSAGVDGTLMTVTAQSVLEGLVFDGNKTNKTGSPFCLVLNGAPGSLVTGCTFKNHRFKVLVIESAVGSRVIGNRFENNGDIANCNQIEVKCADVVVSGNTMSNIGDGHCVRTGYFSGDSVRSVRNITITGNTFQTSLHVGVTCELGSSHITISGNSFEALEAGVKVEASPDASDVTIIGNTFRALTNNTGTCFNFSGPRTSFIGNRVINCPSGPFFGADGLCKGNVFVGSGTAGAYIVALANTSTPGMVCSENYFESITGGAINVGNGSLVRGNRIRTASEIACRVYGEGCSVVGNFVDGAATGIATASTLNLGNISQNYLINCTTPLSYAATANTNVVRDNAGAAEFTKTRTIASGAITVGQFDRLIRVDTEASAATDDLDTISGGVLGQQLIFYSVSATRDTTLKDGTGNLRLNGDCVLGTVNDTITLLSDGSVWREVSRSING